VETKTEISSFLAITVSVIASRTACNKYCMQQYDRLSHVKA